MKIWVCPECLKSFGKADGGNAWFCADCQVKAEEFVKA